MPIEKYNLMRDRLRKNGIITMQAKGDDLRHLNTLKAEASYGHGYILHVGEIPSASGMFEEIIHSTQARIYGEFDSSDITELFAREIAANRMLLKHSRAYGFNRTDIDDISRNLQIWEERFKKEVGASYDKVNIIEEFKTSLGRILVIESPLVPLNVGDSILVEGNSLQVKGIQFPTTPQENNRVFVRV